MLGSIKTVSNLAALATSGLALVGGPGLGRTGQTTGWGAPDARPATVALAADRGDRSGLRIEFNLGDRSRRDHDRFENARFEVAPHQLELRAYQVDDHVLIIAEGRNAAAGFTTYLEACDDHRRDDATLILHNLGPNRGSFGVQCLTPFELTGSVHVRGRVGEIKVLVAGQVRCVRVEQVNHLRG